MYMELSGWKIRHMACGNTTFACAAHSGGDQSVVTWSTPPPPTGHSHPKIPANLHRCDSDRLTGTDISSRID